MDGVGHRRKRMSHYTCGWNINHHGRGGRQKKEDVTLYVWMEHQNRKDSDTGGVGHRRKKMSHYTCGWNIPTIVHVCLWCDQSSRTGWATEERRCHTIHVDGTSRQLYMYVFGVINHHGRGGPQKKEDVTLYVWKEHQNRKDSDMILSALWHFYNHGDMPGLLRDKKKLRLFSDSCYGQNKNINMLSMLFALRKQKQPGLHISYYFTVRSHSFLPADRVFGRIRQQLKKLDTVLMPEEYLAVLRNHGTVHSTTHLR